MVTALLSCAKAIYDTHKREHVTAEGKGKASTLAGEEMLPILCYIIAHGEVRFPKCPPSQAALSTDERWQTNLQVICLGVLLELMTGVCDPVVLNGECGYYLTVLGAALSVRHLLRSAPPPATKLTRMPPAVHPRDHGRERGAVGARAVWPAASSQRGCSAAVKQAFV